ncbi:MAG TPA: L-threonylcarbamoyladenylate synthase [Candidatus Baltobacterales bacterium]|nr:L-threonylcarbamoyladenylate synthase [Candidatus Baltobacterales bacterium]
MKPTRAGLTRAAQLVRGGAVVAFPTDTVYGLGAAADDEVARQRIYHIKGRPVGMPLILMVAAESQLEGWVHVDSQAEGLMRRWWPGPLTLVLHAIGGGTLGVRIPKHKVALELLRSAGPLMTTSANLHGLEPAMTAAEAAALEGVVAVLDGGTAPGGMASTVVDLTGPEPHVLREGAISTPEVLGPPAPRSG